MPKSPFKKKHVKFATEDDYLAIDGSSNKSNGESSESSLQSQNQLQTSENQRGKAETHHNLRSRPPGSQTSDIEIIVENEDGVMQPRYHHNHQDGTSEHCSGCHMLGQTTKHREIVTDDLSDDNDEESCGYSPQQGPHIILMTILCIPFVFVVALVVAGYLGVLTWYNIFLYYYDERGWIHRIVICPLLILSFPPVILVAALCIAVYSSFNQISWYMTSWRTSVTDLEKGFYAWLCFRIGLQECAPYEVITLDDEEEDGFGRTVSHAVSAM
ncbi:transmembrane protein 169-like [Asterias rubens]|uniref:transmembrane protein 169-like n=1 Tax=Asterias rubens TaxID=7604 RepID=UPI00145511D1|nr:transmembrane protein 169-like [Asterias rubens]XP_033624136.1 transmembrane protein 169-like [Asterias rubens]